MGRGLRVLMARGMDEPARMTEASSASSTPYACFCEMR